MRITQLALIVFLLSGASRVHGASIAFCRTVSPTGEVMEVTSPTECNLGDFNPPAFAGAAVFYGFDDGQFQAFAEVSTLARVPPSGPEPPYPDDAENPLAVAIGSVDLNLIATTFGPPRSGLIDLFALGSIDPGGGFSIKEGEASIGSLFFYPDFPYCRGMCIGSFPFPLGQPFDIHISLFSESRALLNSGAGGGVDMHVNFQLRELDGSPVAVVPFPVVAPVPEPSTFLLLIPALTLLALEAERDSFRTRQGGPRRVVGRPPRERERATAA